MASAFLNAIPGIIVQLILIPVVMLALNAPAWCPSAKVSPTPARCDPLAVQRVENDTLQGEPISARSRGTEIPSPGIPPGQNLAQNRALAARRLAHSLR